LAQIDLIARTIGEPSDLLRRDDDAEGADAADDLDDQHAGRALKRLEVVREGFVVRNLDGTAKTDDQANAVILRLERRLQSWMATSGSTRR
jgi:hypothetical protein